MLQKVSLPHLSSMMIRPLFPGSKDGWGLGRIKQAFGFLSSISFCFGFWREKICPIESFKLGFRFLNRVVIRFFCSSLPALVECVVGSWWRCETRKQSVWVGRSWQPSQCAKIYFFSVCVFEALFSPYADCYCGCAVGEKLRVWAL